MSLVKKIISCAAAFMTVIGGALPVNAANTPVAGTKVSFDVYMIMPKGANVPDASYKYTIAPSEGHAADKEKGTMEVKTGIGTPTLTSVGADGTEVSNMAYFWPGQTTYDTVQSDGTDNTGAAFADSVTLKDNEKYAVTPVSVDFSSIEFEEPGIYRYKIDESADENAGANEYAAITSDANSSRYLDVWISSDNDGKLSVTGSVLHTEDDDVKSGTNPAGKNTGYVHRYTTHDLTVSKTVTGNQGSKDKYFEFTVSISNANPGTKYDVDLSNADATTTINGASTEAKTNPDTLTVGDDGTVTQTFWLKHGQSVVVKGIADKSTAEVSEADYKSEGYNASYGVSLTKQISQNIKVAVIPNSDIKISDTGNTLSVGMTPTTTAAFTVSEDNAPFNGSVTSENKDIADASYDPSTGAGTITAVAKGETNLNIVDPENNKMGSINVNVHNAETMLTNYAFQAIDPGKINGATGVTAFKRAYALPSNSVETRDLSAKQDGSVVGWIEGNTGYWYSDCDKVYLNTSCVSSLSYTSYKNIDLSDFDMSKVESMNNMFGNANTQEIIFPKNSSTKNVKDMNGMFNSCSNLQELNLPESFNTENVTNMEMMFFGCSNLRKLNLPESFNTENVKSMFNMFNGCQSLQELNLPESFNTGKATNMGMMFFRCKSLKNITLPDGFSSRENTYTNNMFDECSSLTELRLPDHLSNAQFHNCTSLKKLILGKDFKHIDGGKISNCPNLEYVKFPEGFSFTGGMASINAHSPLEDASDIWIPDDKSMSNYGKKILNFDFVNQDRGGVVAGTYRWVHIPTMVDSTDLNSILKTSFHADTDTNLTFSRSTSAPKATDNTVDISSKKDKSILAWRSGNDIKWYSEAETVVLCRDGNYDNVENRFFSGCSGLKSIDLSGILASATYDTTYMFNGCTSLESIIFPEDLGITHIDSKGNSYWFGYVNDAHSMFRNCKSLKSISLPKNFNISKITSGENVASLFEGCDSLDSLYLPEGFSFHEVNSLPAGSVWKAPDGKTYTAEELSQQFDGSTMAGAYTRVRN